jgi:hypothetical protein
MDFSVKGLNFGERFCVGHPNNRFGSWAAAGIKDEPPSKSEWI